MRSCGPSWIGIRSAGSITLRPPTNNLVVHHLVVHHLVVEVPLAAPAASGLLIAVGSRGIRCRRHTLTAAPRVSLAQKNLPPGPMMRYGGRIMGAADFLQR